MTYPRYPAYKESGVPWLGPVPEHWRALPLLAILRESYTPNLGNAVSTVLSLSYGHIIVRDVESNMGLLPESFETYQIVEPGDIVLRLTDLQNDQRSLRVGKVKQRGIITSAYLSLRATGEASKDFCHLLLHGYDLLKVFYGQGGGVRQSMKYADLKRLPIWLPPPDEQRAIAAFLDRETTQIDALIARLEQLVALLQEKRQALISHAVTKGLDPSAPMKESGIEWLGEIPSHWEVARVGYRYEVQLGKMLDDKQQTGEHLACYVKNVNVQWDYVDIADLPQMDFTPVERIRYALRAGDLLVCEGGEVGRTALWRNELVECFYQKAIHRVRPLDPSKEAPRFLFYMMYAAAKLGLFVATGNPNTIDHLTAEKLRAHRFGFPPFREQCAIVTYLDEAIKGIAAKEVNARESILLLRERRAALITAAVTGQIDVKGLM